MFELNSLLVPVDFSESSKSAFARAMQIASGDDAVVILLHVIDTAVTKITAASEIGTHDDIVAKLKQRAEREMAAIERPAGTTVQVQTIICEGVPFFEIVRKADELLVDAIVIGKFGERGEKLLFGTTAERVIRGSTRPVITLPVE
jgi:universal stress protein A